MSYLSPPIQGILPEPITLLPPGLKTWLSTYRIFYGMVLGPLIFIALGLHYGLGLNLIQFVSAMAAVLILLLNIYCYVLRKSKEEIGLSIWIDLDEIQLLKKGVILHRDFLKNLRVIQMNLPANPNEVPDTLLIEGKYFPRLYIRAAQSIKTLQAAEKAGSSFCVSSEKEWIHLLQALAVQERYS